MNAVRRLVRIIRYGTVRELFFIIALSALVLPSLIAIWQPTPLVYRNLPFPVESSTVRAGESLTLLVDRCNLTNEILPYRVSRTLVDVTTQAKTVLTDGSSYLDPGCERVVSTINVIPDNTKPGQYRIEAISIARIGSRTWNIPWSTGPFTVVR